MPKNPFLAFERKASAACLLLMMVVRYCHALAGQSDHCFTRRNVAARRRPTNCKPESIRQRDSIQATNLNEISAREEDPSASPATQAVTRRSVGERVFASALSTIMIPSYSNDAVADVASTAPPLSTSSSPSKISYIDPSDAQITDTLFLNVRISRQDGTFYVRDDLPDIPENRVFQGKLVVGLFGKVAPATVERFLSYVDTKADPLDDNPMPSYDRSYFTSLDPLTGLLMGGTIPSLQVTDVSGSVALRYGGRLLPAKLWVESRESLQRVSHSRKGLLTHKILEPTPTFGITTRTDTRELDRSHTVFGTLLLDKGDSREFLDLVRDFPTYSVERPTSMSDPLTENVVDGAAEAIFNAQRNFFRSTAKAFGDTRLDKIYEGKILRRIEVTQVGRL